MLCFLLVAVEASALGKKAAMIRGLGAAAFIDFGLHRGNIWKHLSHHAIAVLLPNLSFQPTKWYAYAKLSPLIVWRHPLLQHQYRLLNRTKTKNHSLPTKHGHGSFIPSGASAREGVKNTGASIRDVSYRWPLAVSQYRPRTHPRPRPHSWAEPLSVFDRNEYLLQPADRNRPRTLGRRAPGRLS